MFVNKWLGWSTVIGTTRESHPLSMDTSMIYQGDSTDKSSNNKPVTLTLGVRSLKFSTLFRFVHWQFFFLTMNKHATLLLQVWLMSTNTVLLWMNCSETKLEMGKEQGMINHNYFCYTNPWTRVASSSVLYWQWNQVTQSL